MTRFTAKDVCVVKVFTKQFIERTHFASCVVVVKHTERNCRQQAGKVEKNDTIKKQLSEDLLHQFVLPAKHFLLCLRSSNAVYVVGKVKRQPPDKVLFETATKEPAGAPNVLLQVGYVDRAVLSVFPLILLHR